MSFRVYTAYLNNIMKCVEGYKPKHLHELSHLSDIATTAIELDDLFYMEELLVSAEGEFELISSYSFLYNPLPISTKERLRNSNKPEELVTSIIENLGELIEDDFDIDINEVFEEDGSLFTSPTDILSDFTDQNVASVLEDLAQDGVDDDYEFADEEEEEEDDPYTFDNDEDDDDDFDEDDDEEDSDDFNMFSDEDEEDEDSEDDFDMDFDEEDEDEEDSEDEDSDDFDMDSDEEDEDEEYFDDDEFGIIGLNLDSDDEEEDDSDEDEYDIDSDDKDEDEYDMDSDEEEDEYDMDSEDEDEYDMDSDEDEYDMDSDEEEDAFDMDSDEEEDAFDMVSDDEDEYDMDSDEDEYDMDSDEEDDDFDMDSDDEDDSDEWDEEDDEESDEFNMSDDDEDEDSDEWDDTSENEEDDEIEGFVTSPPNNNSHFNPNFGENEDIFGNGTFSAHQDLNLSRASSNESPFGSTPKQQPLKTVDDKLADGIMKVSGAIEKLPSVIFRSLKSGVSKTKEGLLVDDEK